MNSGIVLLGLTIFIAILFTILVVLAFFSDKFERIKGTFFGFSFDFTKRKRTTQPKESQPSEEFKSDESTHQV